MKNISREQQLEALALKAKSGDMDAYEAIVSGWSADIYRIILNRIKITDRNKKPGTPEDAEEITNAVFYETFTIIAFWNTKNSFMSVLLYYAKKRTYDWFREQKKQVITVKPKSIFDDDFFDSEYIMDENAEKQLRDVENEAVKSAAVSVMHKELRHKAAEIMEKVLNDMNVAEIAEEMNMKENTVKSHIHRAREKLSKSDSMKAIMSSIAFFGDSLNVEDIAVPAGLTAKVMENIVAQNAAGVATTAATATTTATVATVSHTGIGAAIMGLGAGAKAGIAIAAAVVIIGGVAVPVYIHNENQKAVQAAAIIEQQEQERAASEAAEAARIAAEEQAQREREVEAARIAAEKAAAEKAEQERKAAEEKAEAERMAAEQAELERITAEEEAARLEAEAEAARIAAQQSAPQNPVPQQQTPPTASSTPIPPPASSTPQTPPPSGGILQPNTPPPTHGPGQGTGDGTADGSGGDRWRG